LQRSYLRTTRQKKDAANKLVGWLNRNTRVSIQDEMISNWKKGLFGKQVQHSAMGEIKRLLKLNKHTHIVPKRFPTTQLCPNCGGLKKHTLAERVYSCECGFSEHRDLKS
ncbi:MAG: zinc ribbon domain-containing protein, partial [Flammeovirgaceae bacterium]